MSYEQTKSIKIDKDSDTFDICATSNNVSPKIYHWYGLTAPLLALPASICGGSLQFIVHNDKHIYIENLCNEVSKTFMAEFGLGAYEMSRMYDTTYATHEQTKESLLKSRAYYEGKTESYYVEELQKIDIQLGILDSPEKLSRIKAVIDRFVRDVKLPPPRLGKAVIVSGSSYVVGHTARCINTSYYPERAKVFSMQKAQWLVNRWKGSYRNEYEVKPI